MKKFLLFISAASLLLAGCAKEQLVKEQRNDGAVTVVKATFEQLSNGATKAAVTDAGVFTWQNGDKASFAESGASVSYCSGENGAAGATATFVIDGTHTFTSDSWAIYPYDLTSGQTPEALEVTVPASRVWATGQTNVAMYGVKNASAASFDFSHMGGLVRVRVNNVPTNAREFVFKASGYKINGVFDVEEESDFKVIKTSASDTESEQTYTLTWTSAPAAENTMDFYISLPVGTYSGGFAFYLKDEGHKILYQKVGSTSQTITRKKLLLMPAITLMSGAIEPVEKAAVVQEVPAGHSGDFILENCEKVLLKINTSEQNNDITLKYDGDSHLPTYLEIQVVGDPFDKKVSGDLPDTHLDYTQGDIANVEITTSASTFNIVYPATISEKLIVKGGNVVLQGATVQAIEVAETATADGENPVRIVMEKFTPKGGTEQTPAVTDTIVAKANIVVAPAEGVSVKVKPDGDDVTITPDPECGGEIIEDSSSKVVPLTGVFTVADPDGEPDSGDETKVRFSQGNLVATIDASGAPTAWKFAAKQYDCLGTGGANRTIGATAGDVDLFGWSTSTNGGTSTTDNYGIKTSTTNSDYSGDFYDWGKAVGDGNTWRTLTIDEWCYLFAYDDNQCEQEPYFYITTSPRYDHFQSCVTVCDHKNCIVLLPDDWKWEGAVGDGWQKVGKVFEYSEETTVKWSTMEAAGAVCLPAAGQLNFGSNINNVGKNGNYWSSTASASTPPYQGYNLGFDNTLPEDELGLLGSSECQIGYSVRLVTNVPE